MFASHGIPPSGYNGGAEFWANSIEELGAVFQDPEYQSIVVPDELKFLKRDEATLLVGYEEMKWVDGKVVSTSTTEAQ
jgi:hypothetical protein